MGELLKYAHLSDDGVYRYYLERRWGEGKALTWVMLNPSTADASVDDPTIKRCMSFARDWNYDAIAVVNLWPYRSTNPRILLRAECPEGAESDQLASFRLALTHSTAVLASWGANVAAMGIRRPECKPHVTPERLAELCTEYDVPLLSFPLTTAGHPRHPLYVPKIQPAQPYTPETR